MAQIMERSKRDDARRLGAGSVLSRGQEVALARAWVPPAPPGMEFAAKEQGQDETRGTKPVLSEAPVAGQVGAMCTLCERRRRAALQPSTELKIVANVMTPALLLAGFARSHPGHCYDLAASRGCGQCCCLQGFEGLLLAFLLKEFQQKSGMFYSLPLLFWLYGVHEESVQVFCSQLKRLKPY